MMNSQGTNVYNTSANAYNGAVGATGGAMFGNNMANPMMAQARGATAATANGAPATASGYMPFTGLGAGGVPMQGFGAASASGGGYNAAQAAGARDITAGQFAGTDISPYMNPYTSNVVNQTAQDMERARLIEQNQADDAMQSAGAFGGSRHGIANAETNRNFYDRLGATTGALRDQGYQTAMQAAFQDIGNDMQAQAANQASDLSTNQFNASAINQARLTGANNSTQANIANAQMESQLAAQRLGLVNDASRFGADANNTASRFNAQLGADLSRFNAGSITDARAANADRFTANSQFNAGQANNFQQQQFNNQLNGAAQLGGLSTTGFNMGNQISAQQAQDGATARQVQQDLLNAAMQQWSGYTSAGNLGLGQLQSGVSAAPSGAGTTTQTSNPGLLGILGAFL